MSDSAIAQLLSAHHSSRANEKARRQQSCSKFVGITFHLGTVGLLGLAQTPAFKLRCMSLPPTTAGRVLRRASLRCFSVLWKVSQPKPSARCLTFLREQQRFILVPC